MPVTLEPPPCSVVLGVCVPGSSMKTALPTGPGTVSGLCARQLSESSMLGTDRMSWLQNLVILGLLGAGRQKD